MKTQIEIDENLLAEVSEVLDVWGLNAETVITMFLKRIRKEQSLAFMFPTNKTVCEPAPTPSSTPTSETRADKMVKSKAVRLFTEHGQVLKGEITFASKNKTAYNYWANPAFALLNDDWSLILNDNINKTLYLFFIPAHSIAPSQLTPRSDAERKHLIDLQIMYSDPTFTDNRSGFSFKPYLIAELEY